MSSRKKSFLERWRQHTLGNQALVITGILVALSSLVYTGATIVQIIMWQRSAAQTTQQTDRLVKASEDLAHTSGSQVNAMQGQLNAMQEQANALKESLAETRKAANAAVTQANASQTQAKASLAQAGASQMQANVMRGQASTMLRQLEITDRPWLAVEPVIYSPLKFNEDGAYFGVTYRVKNIGRSVATRVELYSRAYVQRQGEDIFYEPVKRQREFCEEAIKMDKGSIGRPSVFPNDFNTFNYSYNVSRQDMEANRFKDSRSVLIMLCGCVEYTFGDGSTHHQTGFIYEVQVLDPQKPDTYHLVRIDEEVPANQLLFWKYPFGGDYAY